MSSPIFIIGANRSGTTLLRLLLNAHSSIAIPDELVYFNGRFTRPAYANWRNPDLSHEEYATFVRRFLRQNETVLHPLSIEELEQSILSDGAPDLRRPYAHALQTWAECHGKNRWGEKTPGNLFYVGLIQNMFPRARFIYLMRDPRAGVHSMNKSVLFTHDAVINALNRRKYMRKGLAHLQSVVPSNHRTLIKYEDLVTAPESTVRALCAFLDEPYEPQMLNFHESSEQYMKPRAANQFNQAATRPITAAKIDAWHQGLTEEEKALVEWICARDMQRHGYAPSNRTPSLTNRMKASLKAAYWYLQNWRHRDSPQYILQDPVLARSRNRIKRWIQKLAASLRVNGES